MVYKRTQSADYKINLHGSRDERVSSNTIGNSPGNITTSSGTNHINPNEGTAKVFVQLLGVEVGGHPNYFYDYNPNYQFYFNGEEKNIARNSLITDWTYDINIHGNVDKYPFDKYGQDNFFHFIPGDTLTESINVQVDAIGSQSGWDISFIIENNNGVYKFSTYIKRATSIKGFSIFIVILSWILTLCQLFISSQAFFRNRPCLSIITIPATM
ncbi:unnamed protein product [Cunninghamella blakesleeana]